MKCSECQCDIKVMHVKNHMQWCGHQFRKGSSLFTHTLQVDCEEVRLVLSDPTIT